MSQALKRSVTLSFTPAQYAWSSLMPRFLLSGNVVKTGARLGSMYLYALGLDANLMNSRQRSALGPPFRMHQPSMAHRFWSQEIFTCPPSSITVCARAAHVGMTSISPVLSICEAWAPPVHHTTTSFLTRSSTLKARSTSHG